MSGKVSKTGQLTGTATRTAANFTKLEFQAQIKLSLVTGKWKENEGAEGTLTGKKK